MKKNYLLFTLLITMSLSAQSVFINEIHYDNSGSDSNEGIEIAGPAGTDLTGWIVRLYNGNGGGVYSTAVLSGVIDDEGAGFGALNFLKSEIQNGAPDGLALIDNTGTVIQFLSYEGTITATSGPANGMTSTDIGVSESGSTAIGDSLQLTNGPGIVYTDFTWAEAVAATPGDLNNGQVFTLSVDENEVAEFSIFPNPTSNGFVNIKTTNSSATTSVSVYNVLGKEVINTTLSLDRLNVSNLNAGVYLLKLIQEGAITTKKLVIK